MNLWNLEAAVEVHLGKQVSSRTETAMLNEIVEKRHLVFLPMGGKIRSCSDRCILYVCLNLF